MLTKMDHPYRLRVGNDVSFDDLRTSPAILIGYSYTRWKEISSQLRYFIDASHNPIMITDSGQPTQFALPNLPPDRRTVIVSKQRMIVDTLQGLLVEIFGKLESSAEERVRTNDAVLVQQRELALRFQHPLDDEHHIRTTGVVLIEDQRDRMLQGPGQQTLAELGDLLAVM